MLVVKPNPRQMRYMRDSASEDSVPVRGGIVQRLRWDRVFLAAGLAGAAVLALAVLVLHW